MGTILIGNIKGPQGSQGIQGPQGPVGPVGPTGPGADIYNGLDQTEAGVAGLDSYQGRVLDQKKLDVAKVANNLTTAGEGYALDARQGKALNENKLDVGRVANNLTTEASGYALDARQGKVLNNRINGLDVIVTETSVDVNITQGLNVGGGKAWTGLGGSAIVPTVPSGYTFAGNVNVTVNGAVGVYATFDGNNQYNSRSVNPYISNASPNALSSGTRLNVRLYSLCYKK